MTYSLYDHDENIGILPTSSLGQIVPDLRLSSGQLDDARQGSCYDEADDTISSGRTSNNPLIDQIARVIAMRRHTLEHVSMDTEASPCHGENQHLHNYRALSVSSYTQHAKTLRTFDSPIFDLHIHVHQIGCIVEHGSNKHTILLSGS